MKTLIATIVFLFCLPTVSQAGTQKEMRGANAEGIILYGDVLDTDCFNTTDVRICNILVRVTHKKSGIIKSSGYHDGGFGLWSCTFAKEFVVNNTSVYCTSIEKKY